ncbi:MAG: glycosyltransferase, partial [Clostridia bacterium]|nr:glycosyltransferase [Clostridia bacterium]
MIKICFVTTVSMTLKAFVVDLAKYLHETGKFEVSMICAPDEEFSKELPPYIRYYPIQMRRGTNLDGISATLKMAKIFKENRFDIVQYSTPNASLYASLAAFIARIPVRLYCQWGIAYVGFSGLKRKIFRFIEKTVCRLSTQVEPDSNGNLKFSHSEGLYGEEKSHVIWNGSASGVNLSKFDISKKEQWRSQTRESLNIPAESTVIIFVGRVTKDKGIIELFRSVKKLIEDGIDVYLLMVGYNENSGDIPEELYQWSVDESRVIYCGFSKNVERLISAADVYVLPSYREGFGSAVVEAEAMGVPVVVSDIPGPTDAMQNKLTGLVVEKANSESLYEGLLRLIGDEETRAFMGANAYEFAVNGFEQQTLFQKIAHDRIDLHERSRKTE